MKRVLSIATLYPNAHQPRFGIFVQQQMLAFSGQPGWDVTVINPIGVPPLRLGRYAALARAAVSGNEDGVEVHRPLFTLLPGLSGRFNPALIARAVLPLARELHAESPFDLVDAQFFYPDGPAAAKIAAELGLPLSIKARGADISHWGRKGYALRRMREAARQAAGLLAVSAALKADMAALGLPAEKITVHYTGLNRAWFYPQDRKDCRARVAQDFKLSFHPSATLLATVGALIPRKRQRLVIEALRHLPATHLLLAGTGPDQAALERLARAGEVAGRVHFLGSLHPVDLARVLCASDAMVLPSQSEGLANAWVEALACGCPLVITDAGGAREVLSRPEAGRIVAADPEAIALGVREILKDRPPREAVADCVAAFSWAANAEALAAYYDRLLG